MNNTYKPAMPYAGPDCGLAAHNAGHGLSPDLNPDFKRSGILRAIDHPSLVSDENDSVISRTLGQADQADDMAIIPTMCWNLIEKKLMLYPIQRRELVAWKARPVQDHGEWDEDPDIGFNMPENRFQLYPPVTAANARYLARSLDDESQAFVEQNRILVYMMNGGEEARRYCREKKREEEQKRNLGHNTIPEREKRPGEEQRREELQKWRRELGLPEQRLDLEVPPELYPNYTRSGLLRVTVPPNTAAPENYPVISCTLREANRADEMAIVPTVCWNLIRMKLMLYPIQRCELAAWETRPVYERYRWGDRPTLGWNYYEKAFKVLPPFSAPLPVHLPVPAYNMVYPPAFVPDPEYTGIIAHNMVYPPVFAPDPVCPPVSARDLAVDRNNQTHMIQKAGREKKQRWNRKRKYRRSKRAIGGDMGIHH